MNKYWKRFIAYFVVFLAVGGIFSAYLYVEEGMNRPDQIRDMLLIGVVMAVLCALAAVLRSRNR